MAVGHGFGLGSLKFESVKTASRDDSPRTPPILFFSGHGDDNPLHLFETRV